MAILILFIAVAACNSQSSAKTKDIDVRVGFSGLSMEFLKNTPPQKVFEESTFPAIVNVKNSGAFSLQGDDKAILSLGVERDYTKSVKRGQSDTDMFNTIAYFNLEGKSQINQKGGEEVISYNVEAGKIDPQSEVHPSSMIAALCYQYKTILGSAVCIDPDISNTKPGKKVCNVQDLTFGSGQGAPVAVTGIEVQMLPTQELRQNAEGSSVGITPQFLILVENRGIGTVIRQDAAKDFCTKSDTSNKNLNIVFVKASLSGNELDCTPKEKRMADEQPDADEKQATVKLKDKKELVRCTLKSQDNEQVGQQDAYLAPLKIEMSYGYTQTISANYFIQKVGR